MRDSIETNVVPDKRTYSSIYERMERPPVTQSWAWGEAKAAAEKWDIIRLAFYRGNEPVGLCQMLRKRFLGVPLVSRINRGPLFCPGLSDTEKLCILSGLRSQFRYMLGGVLFIAPGMSPDKSHIQALRSIGFICWRTAGWHSSIINLQRDTDQIRKGLHSKWRNQLKLSEKSELLLSVSSSQDFVERMVDKHEDNMRRKDFAGPSRDFLRALYKADPGNLVVLMALTSAGPVCGMIVLRHGLNAEWLVGWFGEEGRKLNAGNFLLWNATIEMKRRGCHWLDLGGFGTSERYGHFKIGLGGDEYDLAGEWLCFW